MRRFEETLATYSDRLLHMQELYRAIGVSELTLRACCADFFLGMSPARYLRLRQLKLARKALKISHPATAASPRSTGDAALAFVGGRAFFSKLTNLHTRRPDAKSSSSCAEGQNIALLARDDAGGDDFRPESNGGNASRITLAATSKTDGSLK